MNSVILRPVSFLNDFRRKLLAQQWFTSKLLPAIPRPLRWMLRKLYFLPSDLADRVTGNRNEMIPPKSEIFTGSVDDFITTGNALLSRLVEFAGLSPDAKVLDIGSGMGRLAVALTSFLNSSGSYEGLDIVPSGIEWCNAKIASKYPNFHFAVADIYNKEYNPGGQVAAAEYRFPYDDNTFDLVVLASVFTHLLPRDAEHYVAEIARILKVGGRCYASFSLLDDGVRKMMEAGRSTLRFNQHIGPYWVVDTKVPELAVGYDEPFIHELYHKYGLDQQYSVHYGSWSGRTAASGQKAGFSQDIIVSARRSANPG